MATLRATTIACALLLTIQTAAAADLNQGTFKDLLPSHPKDGVFRPIDFKKSSLAKYYVRSDVSYGYHSKPTLTEGSRTLTSTDVAPTWSSGTGIGRFFADNIRGDITYEARAAETIYGTDTAGALPGRRETNLSSQLLMANLYVDFDFKSPLTPYLGIGFGAVRHKLSDGFITGASSGSIDGKKKWSAAGALMAGVSLDLFSMASHPQATGAKLDIGYRYLYMGDAATAALRSNPAGTTIPDLDVEDIQSHQVRVGVRYAFN